MTRLTSRRPGRACPAMFPAATSPTWPVSWASPRRSSSRATRCRSGRCPASRRRWPWRCVPRTATPTWAS
jgi:hypothetical protein